MPAQSEGGGRGELRVRVGVSVRVAVRVGVSVGVGVRVGVSVGVRVRVACHAPPPRRAPRSPNTLTAARRLLHPGTLTPIQGALTLIQGALTLIPGRTAQGRVTQELAVRLEECTHARLELGWGLGSVVRRRVRSSVRVRVRVRVRVKARG